MDFYKIHGYILRFKLEFPNFVANWRYKLKNMAAKTQVHGV